MFGENVSVNERMFQQDTNVGVTVEDIEVMINEATIIITQEIKKKQSKSKNN